MPPLISRTSEERTEKFHTDYVYYPDLSAASDWLKQLPLGHEPLVDCEQSLFHYAREHLRVSLVLLDGQRKKRDCS